MIQKFSKIYGNMWKFKESLTTENRTLVEKSRKLTEIYNCQPIREKCKICGSTERRYDFHARGTRYWCCDGCGHINGKYEDTEEFCRMLYESDDGIFGSYYEDCGMEYYISRMHAIYSPKANFLVESITQLSGG